MKKFVAWIIIIFCSLIILCFLIGGLSLIFGDRVGINEEDKTFVKAFQTIVGLTIPFVMCTMGIRYGLKQLKEGRPIETTPFNEQMHISFTGKIKFRDYLLLSYYQLYRKGIFIGFTIFGTGFLILGISQGLPPGIEWFGWLLGFSLFFTPVSVYFQVKKTYKANKILHDAMAYTLTNDGISLKGDSLDATLAWNHFIRIQEAKNFILFYQDSILATLIDKNMLDSEDLSSFKRFILSLPAQKEGFKKV